MKKACFYIGMLLLMIACAEKEQKPDYLWEEDRFVDVMVEMQKAEAMIRLGYNKDKQDNYNADSVYSSALRSVNATKQDFDSNYTYYLNHPKAFEKIYDRVIVRLSESAASIEKEKK